MSYLKRFNAGALIGFIVVVAILAVLAVLPSAFAQSKVVLKTYPYPADQAEATATQLRTAYQNLAEVRVIADPRVGQIIVYAPADVQEQIATQLNQPGLPPAPAADARVVGQAPAAPAGSPMIEASGITATNIPLQNITARDFEAKLQIILKNRLATLPNLLPGTNRYQLASAHREGVELSVDLSANQVSIRGPAQGVLGASRLVRAMDTSAKGSSDNMRLIAYQATKPENMQKAVDAVRLAETGRGNSVPVAAKMIAAQKGDDETKNAESPATEATPVAVPQKPTIKLEEEKPKPGEEKDGESTGLSGSVQVEMLEGLDVIVIRGKKRDIEQVASIIEQIEKLSTQTEPSIEIYPLANVNCEAMSALVTQLYNEVYFSRQGTVSITPLIKPNALLLVGRKENVQTVIELIKKLDTQVAPDAEFRVFPLRHATAASVQATIDSFYNSRTSANAGLSTRVWASSDVRSNTVIVQAGPRDMVEISALIARLDTSTSPVVNEVQIVQLKHTMADELVGIIQGAFNVRGVVPQTNQGGAFGGMQQQQQLSTPTQDQRSAILRFLAVDAKGKRRLESGFLNDVRVTADMRANSIVVSAPAESIELLVTLIRTLDDIPLAEAQIKVFTIGNGDASNLMIMLQNLFTSSSQQRTTGGGGAFGGAFGGMGGQSQQAVVLEGGEALIPVRLAADVRTNSIIASGDASNLQIIEALLLRLDGTDVRNRKNHVYRLKNSPAQQVAQAVQSYLQSVTQIQTQSGGQVSPFSLVEQEVIVVAETNSNSLIVSATPRYYDDIREMIEKIDERPPSVMIQVLLAEVTLTDNEEFGVELGLQDGLLFDRSTAATTGGGTAGTPGFNFAGQPLGNNSTNQNQQVGSQGATNFSVGRSNGNLGFGGFTFSASSESVSVLIRALKEDDRLEVLSRPVVQMLDNQLAQIFSGKNVPIVGNTTSTSFGQNYSVDQQQVGLKLMVQPRISPDNLVSMSIFVDNSAIDPGAGVPVTAVNGQVITQPIIDTTQASTVVSAMDGQTVVLGGLFTKSKSEIHRKVPWLGDVPYLGRLFRYDYVQNTKKELLIIMTPHVVRNQADADALRKLEQDRMNWCLADVVKMTGDKSLLQRGGDWSDKDTTVVYPDLDPRAAKFPTPESPEPIPAPEGNSNGEPKAMPPKSQDTPTKAQPPAPLQQPGGMNGTQPPLPPEPPLTPAANGTSMNTNRPTTTAPSRLPPTAQQANYQPPTVRRVQPASYETPAATNSDPRIGSVTAPIYYDAPPSYPTTQAYR
jgi:type II secretion system protein D